jgi:hypothetical protein
MSNSQIPTPEYIKQALEHFKFKPDASTIREDFIQWRKDVGKPTELYADVYKNGKLKLYSRTGLINFPTGQRPNFLSEKFEGKVDCSYDVARLLYQVGFIKLSEYSNSESQLSKFKR